MSELSKAEKSALVAHELAFSEEPAPSVLTPLSSELRAAKARLDAEACRILEDAHARADAIIAEAVAAAKKRTDAADALSMVIDDDA